MRYLILAGLLLLTPAPALAQFRLPIPGIPGLPTEIPLPPIPGLNDLLREQPPISTNLANAATEIALLDDFNPQRVTPMTQLRRGEHGSFILTPGVYEFTAQSYCLHAGTHAPGVGDGYLYAPIEGKRDTIIRHILQNSVDHPDIAQRDIQMLIWSILARTRVNDLSDNLEAVARRLLTRDEINKLNGGALGQIPPEVQSRLFAELPAGVRQVLAAEANLRSLFSRGNASYAQLEQIAVLAGEVGLGEGSRQVPSGRWSLHPDGFFVRYVPSGYSQTRIQVAMPDRYTISRDNLGRITAIADTLGNRTETTYDDTIAPRPHPNDPSLRAYAFRSIRFIRPNPVRGGQPEQVEIPSRGWTFVHTAATATRPTQTPTAHGLAAKSQLLPALSQVLPAALMAQTGDRYTDWLRRSREASDQQQQVRDYWERIDRNTRDRSDADINDLGDTGHYRDGIEAATRGSQAERIDWIAQHQERQRNALLHAICVLGGCDNDSATAYDPSGDVAVPGNTSRQRLAQSARSY